MNRWFETEALEDEPNEGKVYAGLSFGLLACLPLFLAYEWGIVAGGAGAGRNTAELILCRALALFGGGESVARWILLSVVLLVVFVRVRFTEVPIFQGLLRVLFEAVVAAVLLGPILLGLIALFDISPESLDLPQAGLTAGSPSLPQAARLFGAAIWEELLFRVGFYGLIYLFLHRLLWAFFGLPSGVSLSVTEVVALLGSSLAFAAFHLEPFTRFFGVGGEAYEPLVFLWRTLAGLLLAALFRWRGLAVTAWAHGIFNLALVLGVGPGVFQQGA